MKRIAATVALSLAFVLSPGTAQAHHADWPCDFHWWNGVWQRKQLLKCELDRIDPPGTFQYVLGIARCESGPGLMDTDPPDGYAGPYQQAVRYWDARYDYYKKPWDKHLIDKPGNFRANVIISFRMAKSKGTWQQDWACA